ncbi:Rieske (2Fe-2S) protein [Streptomyces sp. SM12]|uniref:Rieske (2Fe-2S) protein n=1 Tax=Streptomyces TaxID=1883 RepID=UPI0035B6A3CF
MTTRRAAVAAGAAGLAAMALGACGSSDDEAGPGGDAGSPPESGGDGGEEAGEAIAEVSDVPEGGGLILEDPQVVVTQPEPGEFKAFSSICTHQNCPVAEVSEGAIHCTCHNSFFSIADGSVTQGPAPAPLPEQAITVRDGRILLD